MRELSLHVLDVIENAVEAGASRIRVQIEEDLDADLLFIEIVDNGRGMSQRADQESLRSLLYNPENQTCGVGPSLLSRGSPSL